MLRRAIAYMVLLVLLAACVQTPAPGLEGSQQLETAAATELFFSEYIEGSSNNKALEIYNGTGSAVDLAAGSYNVFMSFNGGTSTLTINLIGTVANGDVFVLAQSSAVAAILDEADQTNGAGWFNGDDAVVLRKGITVIDVIGQIGFDPGSQWGSGLTSTADNTLRRKASISVGDTNPDDAFDPSIEWDGFATDTFNGLGCLGGPCEVPPVGSCLDAPNVTLISQVQGDGAVSPCAGDQVVVEGVVVADFEGSSPALRGFYVQEQDGQKDNDPLTSEGIFVFNGNNDNVNLGDVVIVTGTVEEFQGQTQIGNVSSIVVDASGASVTPAVVEMPFPKAEDGVPYLERFEGMLVTFPDTLYVTEYFQLGRFGQIVVSSDDRLYQPTNVFRPGPEAEELQDANDRNRIIVDDELNNQNPDPIRIARGGEPLSAGNTLRGGDTVTGLTGVLTYTWAGNSASGNAYRVRPFNDLDEDAPNFEPSNPRPGEPENVGGSIKVSSFNVLNYYTTLDGSGAICGPAQSQDCRGADSEEELERQRAKIIAALSEIEADVFGLIEIENTEGVEAEADLVAGLNEVLGEGTYAYIQTGTIGTDAIKQALLYKPGSVTPLGDYALLDSTVDPRFNDEKNRPALAQTFMENATGARFTVVVNHLKSKGSDCNDLGDPDTGDGQGNCNGTRTAAAEAMADWLASDPTNQGDADVLIIGDLNAYAEEDPIIALEEEGYADLVEAFHDEMVSTYAYTYVFNGQFGYLDHALTNEALEDQVTGASVWHINADEPSVLDYNTNFKSEEQIDDLYDDSPYRSSDHDPVLVGLELDYTPFEELFAKVYEFLRDGSLTQDQADGLLDKLEAIEAALERGQERVVLNQLRAFDNQVRAFVRSGALSAEQGEQLLTLAQALRDDL